MASTINASNSGSGGLISTGDATGALALQTAGTTAVTVDTSQNVGIGTTSPTSKFDVLGSGTTYSYLRNSTTTALTAVDSSTAYFGSGTNSPVVFQVNNGEKMRINSSGNVGIGTSAPANKLSVEGSGASCEIDISLINGTSNKECILNFGKNLATADRYLGRIFYQVDNNVMGFWTNATERMRIDSGGSLLVGTTTSSVSTTPGVAIIGSSGAQGYWLNNNTTGAGTSLALFYSSYSTANQTKFEVDSAGNVKSRTNSYGGFSDERLKQNITPASSQWNDIKSYDVVKFQMKSEQFSDEENPWMLGVVAQQVEQTSPGLVDVDQKDGMKTVKYSILYMKAVKALQEAMTRIETLETKADTQAETINALTARVVALEGK